MADSSQGGSSFPHFAFINETRNVLGGGNVSIFVGSWCLSNAKGALDKLDFTPWLGGAHTCSQSCSADCVAHGADVYALSIANCHK
jgi:hypothetical protein